jgi:hypothetical protein
MTSPKDTTPEIFSDGVFFPSFIRRTDEEWKEIFAAKSIRTMSSPPRQRKPSIRALVKQAEQATGKAVTAITLPDGTKLDFSKPEPAAPDHPWPLDEFQRKETKQ